MNPILKLIIKYAIIIVVCAFSIFLIDEIIIAIQYERQLNLCESISAFIATMFMIHTSLKTIDNL